MQLCYPDGQQKLQSLSQWTVTELHEQMSTWTWSSNGTKLREHNDSTNISTKRLIIEGTGIKHPVIVHSCICQENVIIHGIALMGSLYVTVMNASHIWHMKPWSPWICLKRNIRDEHYSRFRWIQKSWRSTSCKVIEFWSKKGLVIQ